MTDLADLSPGALLKRAGELVRARRAPAVEDLEVVLAWADRHGAEPPTSTPGGDRLVRLGGDGTPLVRDLSVHELAIARETTAAATRSAIADALDLRHRLPMLWAAVRALEVEAWVARKVAARSRKLSRHAVGIVDQAVTDARHESPSRLLTIAEAKVIEADTDLHAEELAAAATRRGVWLARRSTDGATSSAIRTVVAKVSPDAAYWVNKLVDRTAAVLARTPEARAEHHPELSDDATRDELRAAAFGWLARPDAFWTFSVQRRLHRPPSRAPRSMSTSTSRLCWRVTVSRGSRASVRCSHPTSLGWLGTLTSRSRRSSTSPRFAR